MFSPILTFRLVFGLGVILLGGLLLFSGCGGDDETVTGPDDLLKVQWPATSGLPLDLLPITGLPGEAGNYHIEVVDADGSVRAGSPVLDIDDSHFFPVPFHPDGSADGGQVEIRVVSGQKRSSLISFTIDPLPVVTTTVAELVMLLRNNLQLRAQLMNTSVAALAGQDWAELDVQHIPLRVVWSVLDDPANANRLSELAEGRAPALGDGELDLELLERTLGRIGLGPALISDNAELQLLIDKQGLQGKARIETVEELSAAMTQARDSATRLDENSAVHQLNRDLGLAMTILGFIPHPAAQLTSAAVGALQFAYSTARQSMANLLPSEFVELAFDVSHPFFNEDSEETGSWTNARVIATNLGWQLDATIVDGLLTLGGLGSAASGWMNRFEAITSGAWINTLRDFLVNNNLKELAAMGDGQIFEIDPELFGPIDVTGLPWTRGFTLTDVISIPVDQDYIPLRVGTDQLEIRTGEGLFGGAYVEADQTIEVRAIAVDLDPNGARVDNPGDTVTFRATVQGADDPGLFWNIAPATWVSEPVEVGPGVEEAIIMTPLDENEFPFQITVTSTATGGLRESSTEARYDAAIISSGNLLVVEPGSVCLDSGESAIFTAYLDGEATMNVTWSLGSGAGSIGATTGIYTSPTAGAGTATIVATSTLDDSVQASATARYGACTCYWSASAGGTPLEGTEATISSGLVTIGLLPSSDVFLPSFQLAADGIPNGPGTYPAVVSYSTADGFPWTSENLGGGEYSTTVTINALTETYVEGTFSGYVIHSELSMNISGSFHAAIYAGSGPSPCAATE